MTNLISVRADKFISGFHVDFLKFLHRLSAYPPSLFYDIISCTKIICVISLIYTQSYEENINGTNN